MTEGPCFGQPVTAGPTGMPPPSNPCGLGGASLREGHHPREHASGGSGQVCHCKTTSLPRPKDLAVGRIKKSEGGKERWEKVVT